MQPDCKNRPGLLRRAFAALLLAACVLAGQSGVALHDLGHALEPIAASHHAPSHDGCDEPGDEGEGSCPLHALFAELGSVAVGALPALAASPASFDVVSPEAASARPAHRVAFRSRAPPAFPA